MRFRNRSELYTRGLPMIAMIFAMAVLPHATAAVAEQDYKKQVEPIIQKYCFDCHGDGMNKGEVAFDTFTNLTTHLQNRKLWLAVWDNLQSQMMPPAKKPQPGEEERRQVIKWIERAVFKL